MRVSYSIDHGAVVSITEEAVKSSTAPFLVCSFAVGVYPQNFLSPHSHALFIDSIDLDLHYYHVPIQQEKTRLRNDWLTLNAR